MKELMIKFKVNELTAELMKKYLEQMIDDEELENLKFECHWDGEPGEPGYNEGDYIDHYDGDIEHSEHYDSPEPDDDD